MGLLPLLIAALAASAAMAADPCACVDQNQIIDSINKPMIFFQQPTEGGKPQGVTCSMNCLFNASLPAGMDAYTLQLQVLTNSLTDGILEFNGLNATNNVINSNTPVGALPYYSYGDSITIQFTEPATTKDVFMIVVQKVLMPRPEPPMVKTTTLAPPTAPYDPKFTHNPRLVANDIMLAFDLSSPDLGKFKTFAQNMIKELAINPKSLDSKDLEDCGAGSRLSLVGLSSINGFDNLYAPYWTTTDVQAIGNIESFVQISSGDYYLEPIKSKYIYGFDIPKEQNPPPPHERDNAYTNCTNKEKLLILFTSTSPNEYNSAYPDRDDLEINFLGNSVHQILVHYNLNDKDKKFYELSGTANKDNAWNYFQLTGGDKDIENFFNSYLVDSREPMTCQLKSTNNKVDVVIGVPEATEPVIVNIPPYYDAKSSTSNSKWETVRHYCNFQETTVRILKDPSLTMTDPLAKTPICLRVYYDLETGKDFVSIFSGDPQQPALQDEVVRLTGRDVSGTYFDLTDALGSIVFSSDEKNVFDGFRAEIKKGECSP